MELVGEKLEKVRFALPYAPPDVRLGLRRVFRPWEEENWKVEDWNVGFEGEPEFDN